MAQRADAPSPPPAPGRATGFADGQAAAAAIDLDLRGTAYEVFILLLSGLSIVNVVILTVGQFAGLAGPTQQVVLVMEVLLSPVYLVDVLLRIRTARSPARFLLLHHGWLDLLAVLPYLRILRAFRVVRTVRALRRAGSAVVLADLGASRAIATFLMTIFLVIVVVELSGATIYYAELGAEGSNIATAGDAIWWALVTITTVGYGDRFPVTTQGRVIGVLLLFAGIALFSVLTGFIANAFLAPNRRLRRSTRPGDPATALRGARELLARQEEHLAALRAQLDELERLLSRHREDGSPEPESRREDAAQAPESRREDAALDPDDSRGDRRSAGTE